MTLSTSQTAKRVSPSVVVLQGKTDSGDVLGSGFVVTKDGKIVTNLHVIRDMKNVTVQTATGEIFDSISVLATDERRDLAIVKIAGFNLSILELGNSDAVTVGEPVVIVGSPRGLEGTITAGILSAVRDSGEGFKVLQTDAAVNPGNSGGPLVNNKGQAIGVVSFKLRSAEGLNFAVPINYIRGMLNTRHEPMSLEQMRGTLVAAPSEILTEVSHAKMRSILQGMGFDFTEKASDDSRTFSFQLGGYKVVLLNQVKDMQLYAGYTDKVDPTKINEWNTNYRFSRAYVNDKGGPSLENDLYFAGGVTKDTIEAFIKQFRTTLTTFIRFLPETTPAAETVPTTSSSPAPSATLSVSSQLRSYNKPASARKRIKAPFGNFAMWIDESQWKQGKSNDVGTLTFTSTDGDLYARVISERIGLPTDTLKDVVLSNLRDKDQNGTIVLEEKRIINGKQVLVLQMDMTVSNVPFRFFGYCYGGTSGTIQVWTYTAQSIFDKTTEASTQFLNGLEISDEDLSPSTNSAPSAKQDGLLYFNTDKMSIKYDQNKWKQKTSGKPGHFEFEHSSGDAYAMIIAERIAFPTDSLPDIALSNAKDADPNAAITFREKRRVNGVDVWFVKIEGVLEKTPFIYYGYYYGGKNGSVQVVTYTGKSLMAEYEKDFMEFLNGFSALE
jgi:hypothetical protein